MAERSYESEASEIDKAILESSPYYKNKKDNNQDVPPKQHNLIYNSSSETLEPVYFWLLDYMNSMFGGNVVKIMDNFASSPGSGHFSELQGKMSQMQQEASRVLGTVNNILKGVLNLIYDLKEFKIRLSHYDAAKSKDKVRSETGILSLKQMWMDKVDMQRGQGSINAMSSGNLNFVTLRDAFLSAQSVRDVDSMDLNQRVKRILKPRVQEFFEWRKRSEQELRKRFEIEKIYLKSQTDALKLNARWAKPYLRTAAQLAQNAKLGSRPELVHAFNTIFMNLTLMGRNKISISKEITSQNIPYNFRKLEKKIRGYNSIVFLEFKFRGIPGKAGQHYVFGGRADVTFKAYALNDEELALFEKKLDESDLDDSLNLVQGMTDDSLLQLKLDLDEFLVDSDEEEKQRIKEEDINPFSSLLSFAKSSKKETEKKAKGKKAGILNLKDIKKDTYPESYLRNIAETRAMNTAYMIFRNYKKGHGMASAPAVELPEPLPPRTKMEEFLSLGKASNRFN